MHDDLYVLENPHFLAFYSTRQQATSDEVWHMRLGHPQRSVLQQLSNNKTIIVNKISSRMCDACQLGKIFSLPFLLLNLCVLGP